MNRGEINDMRGRTFWISIEAINILNIASVNEKRQKSDLVDEAIKEHFKRYSKKIYKK